VQESRTTPVTWYWSIEEPSIASAQTPVKAPAAPRRGHVAANHTVTPKPNNLVRYVGPESLLGPGSVDSFQSTASGSMTMTENLLVDYC
jgi:hypothetical protein